MARITLIQTRRGTSAQWASTNPILAAGEQGYDTTVKKYKMGDGAALWSALPFDDASKADLNSPTFTGTVTLPSTTNGLSKTNVGLGNVDNTADTAKPVSTAQQTALNLKANLASPVFTGTPSLPSTTTGLTKSTVGLGNVDNTSDTAKPVSTAQATAIANVGQSDLGANTVVRRDVNGNAKVADPTNADHIATKRYVDALPAARLWPTYLGSKIGFIGDSYSSGLGLTNPSTERWPKLLADMVGATESNVAVPSSGYVNEGSGGNSKFSTQATLLSSGCDTVIVCGGINDAPLGQSDAQIATAVTTLISVIEAYQPQARIIFISPMHHAALPTAILLNVERQIRAAIPAEYEFIERGPWIRLDKPEWQIWDGHPNALGAQAIAAWVAAQLGREVNGSTYCKILPPGTSDVALNSTNFPGWVLGQDTIWNAKPGWWEYRAELAMYNAAVNGSIWVMENNSRKITNRSDHVSNLPSPVHRIETEFWHPGGDLTFKFGYDPNNTNMMVLTNNQTKAFAKWLGVN